MRTKRLFRKYIMFHKYIMFRRILSHRPFSHKNLQQFKYGKQIYKELYAEIEKTNTRIDDVLVLGIFPVGISAATVFFSLLKAFS